MKILRYLITGGCGSIGSALVVRLLNQGHTVCSLDNSESELFNQIQSLSKKFPNTYKPFLGDIRDYERLFRAFSSVEVVFHCAALKHVELSEYNPFEVLKTNVEGTHNVVEACLNNNVKKLIFASSDKAVNPSSTMGASKLLAERIIISSSSYAGSSGFKSACVRFGNVWDTAGSVGKIFKAQVKSGMPITLTSRKMTRFFITIEKALDLPPDRVVKEIVQKKDVAKSRFEKGVDKDYNKVRDNLFDLLDSSKDAIEGIMSVAMAGDQPRAYEVIAQLLKVSSDINKDIMEIHRKMKETSKTDEVKSVTNNAFFVGSTSDLAKMIEDQTKGVKKVSSKTKEIIQNENDDSSGSSRGD